MKWIFALAGLSSLVARNNAQLIISGGFDGPLSGGNPKFVELYATQAINDLTGYQVDLYSNDNTFPGTTVDLTGAVEAGEFLYVAATSNGGSGTMESYFGGIGPDFTTSFLSNGDDTYTLNLNDEIVDIFGVIGTDGSGELWEFMDGWFKRTIVDSTVTPTATFDVNDWTLSGPNSVDGCGTTNCDCPSVFPIGSGADCSGGDDEVMEALISEVQGNGTESPLVGTKVMIQGIVTGVFHDPDDSDDVNYINGFFVQEEAADMDADDATSEGVFIYDPDITTSVAVGDEVSVIGTVGEFFGNTQISSVTNVTVVSSGNTLPPAATVSLPTASFLEFDDGDINPDLEKYEGMLVTFSEDLAITEMYQLDRYNEIKLATERFYQFTQQNLPDTTGFAAHMELVGRSTITYDDGITTQNVNITLLDGFQDFPGTPIRMGDTVSSLTGVIYYSFDFYRLLSTTPGSVSFTSANPRPALPTVMGDYIVATLNVLNYFTTLDDGSDTSNGNRPRGADNSEEFDRQQQKLLTALTTMDADIFALVEIENDFMVGAAGNALENLTNALNTELGSTAYNWVYPGQRYVDASDAISVGFIHKVAVTVEGVAVLDDTAVGAVDASLLNDGPIFDGESTNRAALAATFSLGGNCITIANNHFKSKGGSGSGEDADMDNGAGNYNRMRTRAAEAVVAWLDTDPTGSSCEKIAITGDLNAYANEDPIRFLTDTTFNTDAKYGEVFASPEAQYSFVFDSMIGTLDYMLVNGALASDVSDAQKWHINEDEPDAIDYNLDFGRLSTYFDGSSSARNSDHSPVIVGLTFDGGDDGDDAGDDGDDAVGEPNRCARNECINVLFFMAASWMHRSIGDLCISRCVNDFIRPAYELIGWECGKEC